MKSNYHTHTYLCRHAVGNVEDYVKEAIKQGFEEIGMSDHVPFKMNMLDVFDDMRSRTEPYTFRMSFEEMDGYLEEIDICREKYGNVISILKGFEAEYFSHEDDYYKFLLERVDYLVLGNHLVFKDENGKKSLASSFDVRTKNELELYRKQSIEALNTGYFKIFAHPDLYMNSYAEFDDLAKQTAIDIIETAIKNDVILEYNANGLRESKRYPNSDFWKIVSDYKEVKVMVNSDCHDPRFLNDIYVLKSEEQLGKLAIKIQNKI